jgi:hypothetical protein
MTQAGREVESQRNIIAARAATLAGELEEARELNAKLNDELAKLRTAPETVT